MSRSRYTAGLHVKFEVVPVRGPPRLKALASGSSRPAARPAPTCQSSPATKLPRRQICYQDGRDLEHIMAHLGAETHPALNPRLAPSAIGRNAPASASTRKAASTMGVGARYSRMPRRVTWRPHASAIFRPSDIIDCAQAWGLPLRSASSGLNAEYQGVCELAPSARDALSYTELDGV